MIPQSPPVPFMTLVWNLFTPIVPYHNTKCHQLTATSPTTTPLQTFYCQSNARYQVIFLWVVTALMIASAGLFHNLFPLVQFAHIGDVRYHYPYLKESVSSIFCFLIAGGTPFAVLMLPYLLNTTAPQSIHHKYNISSTITEKSKHGEKNSKTVEKTPSTLYTTRFQGIFSSSVLGCFISLGLGTFLTTLFKTIVGRPRPNALSLTKHIYTKYSTHPEKLDIINSILSPAVKGSTDETVVSTQVTEFLTNTPHMLSSILTNDALRSFPSGHSCFAFAGMIYLSLVLYTRYLKTVKFATTSQHTSAPLRVKITPRAILNAILYPIDYDRIKSLHCCYHPPSTLPHIVTPLTSPVSYSHMVDESGDESTPLRRDINDTFKILDKIDRNTTPRHQYHHHGMESIEIPPLALAMLVYIVLPIIIAGLIAISRIIDFWHHPDDVLAGSVLGICCAFLTFRIINT